MKKEIIRCSWLDLSKPDYVAYHDEEWGIPVHDDRKHFEFMILESAQAGLSWYTILKRRNNYKKAFADYDPAKVAKFTEEKIEKLLLDEGIIRNRLKVTAAVNNAKLFLGIQKEFGSFDTYIWSFTKGKTIVNQPKTTKDFKTTSPESDALSMDLKKRGFKFMGSTIVYAHMQACGLVDDHTVDCFCKGRNKKK